MISDEHPLADWLTGLRAGDPSAGPRTVVVQAVELLGDLVSGGLVDDRSLLFVQSAAAISTESTALWGGPVRTFDGIFTLGDDDIVLDNGYRLHVRHYGSAEFHCLDTPTALRVTDADDLSAYLRDADEAWDTGTFARHITHPNAIVPDLAGLGAAAERSGPMDRLYVFADAAVSTSPTGTVLGTATETLPVVQQRWRSANEHSHRPDAVCLGQVVGELDRTEALAERPWLSRYLLAVNAIQTVRRQHRLPSRVSGFGGRLTSGVPRPTVADTDNSPVLLQVGYEFQAHDTGHGAYAVLSADDVATIEWILAEPSGATEPTDSTRTTVRLLAEAGVSEQWRRDVEWE